MDCAPCEAPDGHPLFKDMPRFHQRTPAEMLMEEAYDWARPLTDDECLKRCLVGIDVNMAFAGGANGTIVGLGAPTHVKNPVFDPKLPSPFTRKGNRPEGPAWYAMPTVAYAVELGAAPLYAARLFDAKDRGASDQELQEIAAEELKDVHFQDGSAAAEPQTWRRCVSQT